jgi:hypothetical protein
MPTPNNPPPQRKLYVPKSRASDLGPLTLLPGKWTNAPNLLGRGWNMIALPFAGADIDYRLLVNQYNEELEFFLVDENVPNRGIERSNGMTVQTDQLVVTVDYEQDIDQIKSADFPVSGQAGGPGLPIHHEPGLWLYKKDQVEDGLDIARLASIPHGDSVLALGRSRQFDGPPTIPAVNGLPIGVSHDLNGKYLAPYKHFHEPPFENLFDPTIPHKLLEGANKDVTVKRTTELEVDTTLATGRIANIQFVTKHANATTMKSTFWIEELVETTEAGAPRLRMQYLQVVMLEFFPRRDGVPGLIQWPHVSINTLEWIGETSDAPREDKSKG